MTSPPCSGRVRAASASCFRAELVSCQRVLENLELIQLTPAERAEHWDDGLRALDTRSDDVLSRQRRYRLDHSGSCIVRMISAPISWMPNCLRVSCRT